jgi:hypothetical protein
MQPVVSQSMFENCQILLGHPVYIVGLTEQAIDAFKNYLVRVFTYL